MTISKRDIDGMKTGTILWDSGRGSVSGFGVRRQKSEIRTFVLKYQKAGRGRWVTIGRFGSPWAVDAARSEAKRLLGEVAAGLDPAANRDAKGKSIRPTTVAELCKAYMSAAHAGLVLTRFQRPKKKATLDIDAGRISRHIAPTIGRVSVKDLDARIVRSMIAEIAAGKTAVDEKTGLRGRAIVTGGQTTAARVADLLSGIMAWAVEEGYATQNPVHGVRRYRAEPKQRFLSNEEIRRLGAVFATPCQRLHPYALAIIELLLLTGCRLSEIAKLRWSEVDFQNKCLRLEDTKTGQSMRAIGDDVLNRLQALGCHHGSDFVFPASRGDGAYQGTKRVAGRIFDAAGIMGASSHTLRHTFASVASDLGYSDATIAGLLGHAGRGVTSRYVHRPDHALRAAANTVSSKIVQFLEPSWPGEKLAEPAQTTTQYQSARRKA